MPGHPGLSHPEAREPLSSASSPLRLPTENCFFFNFVVDSVIPITLHDILPLVTARSPWPHPLPRRPAGGGSASSGGR